MPRTQIVAVGRQSEVKMEHPERMSSRMLPSWDLEFKTWSSRETLARAIRMQERREAHSMDWKAVIPLTPGEGY